ncbi:MAG: glucosamine-6-phosphate deaminase [Oscillospiraceae bacterium]|nr:glucosamine-6-phosphate deaminase [Oscillospiraceae bacterium]MDD6147256.1 glucosamine-6-phosphate deaminase [Oscillospiraceae bacterium]
MRVIVKNDPVEISHEAAEMIVNQINKNHGSVIGFATGASPVETYKRIIEKYQKGEVSLKHITTFNLDEYVGLSRDNVNSYFYFMKENLFGKTDVDFDRVNFLSGEASDLEAECERYYNRIKECGGIDIQLLGIGTNGHIGFNEPGEKFMDRPFSVKLTQSTIDSNRKYFEAVGDKMPEYALTMGIGDIMRSKKIILIATGESKAKAVKQLVEGEVSPSCPATILKIHSDVTVFLDPAAASLLGDKK